MTHNSHPMNTPSAPTLTAPSPIAAAHPASARPVMLPAVHLPVVSVELADAIAHAGDSARAEELEEAARAARDAAATLPTSTYGMD
jgi:hypothetical protein